MVLANIFKAGEKYNYFRNILIHTFIHFTLFVYRGTFGINSGELGGAVALAPVRPIVDAILANFEVRLR